MKHPPARRRPFNRAIFACLFASAVHIIAAEPEVLPPPPQDQGLPYTRSAEGVGLAKIKDGVAVFVGSRYGYVHGVRVRLDDKDLLHAEAVLKDGQIYVPEAFAAAARLKEIHPEPVPPDLAAIADRWVYAPGELTTEKLDRKFPASVASLPVRGSIYYSLNDLGKAEGLVVTRLPSGLLYLGAQPLIFDGGNPNALKDVITLFDTPDKLADPDIATALMPTLKRQGKWTDHVRATPEQLAILNGPETEWPTAPKSEYDLTGFNARLLGSKVPAPGVYPRLLFSPQDVPMIAAQVKGTRIGQMSLMKMEYLFQKTWWDPATSDGEVFKKLSSGDLSTLEWDAPPGTLLSAYPHLFKGQTPGIFNTHVAYVPDCLTAMAYYCLITGDDAHGRQAAAAIANYFKMREKLVDEYLKISDSEFGSSSVDARGGIENWDGNGAKTQWRNIHGVVPNMNLALALDFAGKWMTPEEKDGMRRLIAKVTYGRRSYAQDGPVRFRDVNWCIWDLPDYMAVTEIEGLPGYDPEAAASGAETVRAFCDWGIDDSGVVFESTGKNPGALQFHFYSMVALARRGENLLGHPHYRKLLDSNVQMTSPDGKVVVNSGTQYEPYSRQRLTPYLVRKIKAFFPNERQADYLGAIAGEPLGDLTGFDAEAFRKQLPEMKRLRLPSPSYPGMTYNALYEADLMPTTRADLNMPLDFDAPVQGVFSSYSDRSPEAVWMHMYVRPHHYIGAGHHHADAGMFHFSASGVDWFTQSPFDQEFAGKYFNLVQVDGQSEPTPIPGGPLGYNGVAKYLGSESKGSYAAGQADLTYAYSWRWMTQAPQVWSDELKAMPWELDPGAENLRNWAGTARYKMRPWWTTYNYVNYMPTCRAPFNPMQYVRRNVELVRGPHPYGVVTDDLKKDDQPHLYSWAAMLNGGVWKANVPGLPANMVALGYRAGDPDLNASAQKPALEPKTGEPLLLVCALGMSESGDPQTPLFQVETAPGANNRQGKLQYYDRLMINHREDSAAFRVLLLPVKAGEPLPEVTYDAGQETATVRRPGAETDSLHFVPMHGDATFVSIKRDGRSL